MEDVRRSLGFCVVRRPFVRMTEAEWRHKYGALLAKEHEGGSASTGGPSEAKRAKKVGGAEVKGKDSPERKGDAKVKGTGKKGTSEVGVSGQARASHGSSGVPVENNNDINDGGSGSGSDAIFPFAVPAGYKVMPPPAEIDAALKKGMCMSMKFDGWGWAIGKVFKVYGAKHPRRKRGFNCELKFDTEKGMVRESLLEPARYVREVGEADEKPAGAWVLFETT